MNNINCWLAIFQAQILHLIRSVSPSRRYYDHEYLKGKETRPKRVKESPRGHARVSAGAGVGAWFWAACPSCIWLRGSPPQAIEGND